jgi:ornithine cyclodeaminase/alanine dehydrogenase-like protein (mu-crystallin family)
MTALPYLDAERVGSTLNWPRAIEAIGRAVATINPAHTPPRSIVGIGAGELLLMPAEVGSAVGVKVLTIAPGNPALGAPRIQGLYVLFDGDSAAPRAVLDGAALTTLRTPAVSAFAVDRLAPAGASTLTVFGTGPQAEAHVHAIGAIRALHSVTVVGRDEGRSAPLVERLRATGVDAASGRADSVATADIVVCATTARQPLFDGHLLGPASCVVAIGSHEPDARELDDAVFRQADRVVVEDQGTAMREAGDIIIAIGHGALSADRLHAITELTHDGELRASSGVSVFKSVGMGWQDLAIAQAIADAALN